MNLDLVLLISRLLHIGSAILAIGGAAFLAIALIPGAKETLDETADQRLRESVRRRWARIVHLCIALLLLTGAINFAKLALIPKVEPMPYHAIFGIKFIAALVVFFLGSALVGKSPAFANMRSNSRKWLTWLVAIGLAIVLLSGMLNQVRTAAATSTTATIPATTPPP